MNTADEILKDAHNGIVGIDDTGGVWGGYDEGYREADQTDAQWPGERRLPAIERVKLAQEMLRRWNAYLLAALADSIS